ncbi:MAG: hypothetical protein MJ210_05295, partial [Alphaproteobacteria bacterium]|nr:hypothetical protein [Alphaproteobacteria bacterium]
GYNINVYQTEDIDTCYLNNKLSVISCKEKISIPMSMNGNFSLIEKILLLTSQWLSSTGLVSDINPVLNALKYLDIDSQIAPFGFSTDKLSVVNSIAALDQIAYNIDHQNGKQAYFAIIDMPLETYVYDEYCQIKPMSEWTSEKSDYNQKTINDRRIDYAQQVSCLYGSLGKFILQLQKMEMLDRTTIIIEGLINPLNLSKPDNDFYAQMQNKQQTALAIRKSSAPKAEIDYTVCSVGEFLNSFFFTGKNCEEFSGIKLSLSVKQQINNGKYSENLITNAKRSYDNWFKIWKVKNQIESSYVDNLSKNKDEQAPSQEATLDTELETAESSVPEASVEFENIKISETEVSETKEATPEIQEEKIEETITEEIIIPVVKETAKEQLPLQEKETTAQKIADTQETKGQDVIPETLFDTKPELKKEVQKNVKKKSLISPKKPTVKTTKKNTASVKSAVEKDIRETTGTQKQKLSPEELKKRYHETLKKRNNQKIPHHEVSIKVYEN